MPFPEDTTFPAKVSLAAWNKARKGVGKEVKTGVGAKLKAYEAAWNAINFADLNPANLPDKPREASARLDKAKAAYPAVVKATKALKAASDLMLAQSSNPALHDASRKWLAAAVKTHLPPVNKTLVGMKDLVGVFSQHYSQVMGPGGAGMQALHVRREWERHLLKVDANGAEAALRLGKPGAWLVRLQGSDLTLSQRNGDDITHRDLEALIDDIKSLKDLGLSANDALTDTDIRAARLVAKQQVKSGKAPDPVRDGKNAKLFQNRLNKNAQPQPSDGNDEDVTRLRQIMAVRQMWERQGVHKVSAQDAEAALMTRNNGNWLVRKEGNKSMLSARKGGQVTHQDLEPLITNRKGPKDVSLDESKALNETALRAALKAAEQLKNVDVLQQKLGALAQMPGYFATLTTDQAVAKLAQQPEGTWLIRASSHAGVSVLSRKEKDNKVMHYRLTTAQLYDEFIKFARGAGRRRQLTQ